MQKKDFRKNIKLDQDLTDGLNKYMDAHKCTLKEATKKAFDLLLNNINEVKPEGQKVTNDKAQPNLRCKHGWFYNKPIKQNGQVVDWEKVIDCPMLTNDKEILKLPLEKQYRILLPNCTPEKCKVKELNDKREKKIFDKSKGHSSGMTDERRQRLMRTDYLNGVHGEGSYYVENPVTHRIEVIHDATMRGFNPHPSKITDDLDKDIADFDRKEPEVI